MNKRIRELAEQAWDATAVSPDFGHPVSFAGKFAQLIVKECIDTVLDCTVEYATRPQIADELKEHFGVEE